MYQQKRQGDGNPLALRELLVSRQLPWCLADHAIFILRCLDRSNSSLHYLESWLQDSFFNLRVLIFRFVFCRF